MTPKIRLRPVPRAALLSLVLVAALAACGQAPREVSRTVTTTPPATGQTFLERTVVAPGNPRDGRSGMHLVSDGPEALALRVALAARAERTIDAQYYLLHNDDAGVVFANSLVEAADRGVRVRLLLDDMDVAGYDAVSAALDTHPNIEIRLFNPFRRGLGRNIGSLFEFSRVNRRMHNKSFTADGAVTIVGGRNIGDEYFAARDDSNYNDLDVLGAGPIAREVSENFDSYWNSPYAIPARAVVQQDSLELGLDEAQARLAARMETALETPYLAALQREARGYFQRNRGQALTWVPARLLSDPPEKAAGEADAASIVVGQVTPYLQRAEDSLFVSSAYFVPRKGGTRRLAALSGRGVDVTILTNSLASTDVLPVYGHYARSRTDLLEAGVNLWELRPDFNRGDRTRLGLGLSQSSLHTKAFAVDRRFLFVGSFNWDPRSAWLNNEMVVLMDSPALASDAVDLFTENLRRNAYELLIDDAGGIDWMARTEDGGRLLYKSEPTGSGWDTFLSRLYGVLPMGGQL